MSTPMSLYDPFMMPDWTLKMIFAMLMIVGAVFSAQAQVFTFTTTSANIILFKASIMDENE